MVVQIKMALSILVMQLKIYNFFFLGIILLHGCALTQDSSDHVDSSLPLYILTYRGLESVKSWIRLCMFRIYLLIVIATACTAVLCIVN
jgi:hypothetical protein